VTVLSVLKIIMLKDRCYVLIPIGTCNDTSDNVLNMLQSVNVIGLGNSKEQRVAEKRRKLYGHYP